MLDGYRIVPRCYKVRLDLILSEFKCAIMICEWGHVVSICRTEELTWVLCIRIDRCS